MGGEKNDCIICSVVEAKYCSIFFLFLPHARTRRRFLLDFLLPLPRNICISFGNTIPFRPNKSLVSRSLPLEREEEEGGQRREGPSQHTGTRSRIREIVRSGREGREIGRSNRADVNCVYLLASSLGKVSLPRLISDETAQSRGEALFPHQRDQATVRQLRLDRRRFVLARVAALLMMTSAAPRALLLPRVLLLLQRLLLGTSVHVNAAEAVY